MNLKIFSNILPLEYNDSDAVKLGKQALNEIAAIENEVTDFVADKKGAKVEWHQSCGSASRISFGAKAIPFTQLTAIVQW